MPLLNEEDAQAVREHLRALVAPVEITLYTRAISRETCPVAESLLKEVGTDAPREKLGSKRCPAVVPLRNQVKFTSYLELL